MKTRGEVRGGGKKPYRQKKTGRARAGTSRSPLWIGGGSIFGPMPHDYVVKIPSKVRTLARKSALTYKAQDASVVVVEDFSVDAAKTREVAAILKAFSLQGKKTLLLTAQTDRNLQRSGRNIASLVIREADKASTVDILNNQVLMIQKSAVGVLQNSFKQ